MLIKNVFIKPKKIIPNYPHIPRIQKKKLKNQQIITKTRSY